MESFIIDNHDNFFSHLEPTCERQNSDLGVMMDRFEDRNEPISALWESVVGGALGRGCGEIDSGSSLYFSDKGTREAKTVPLDTTDIRYCASVIKYDYNLYIRY